MNAGDRGRRAVEGNPLAIGGEGGEAAWVLIEFRHAPRGECQAWVHRPDGVVVWLPSYSRKWRVPHDLAHAVTERELGLAEGVFGSIASGAVFENMRVVSGRPRYDARAVSARVLRANRRALSTAEALAGVLHQAVEHRRPVPQSAAREAWGVVNQDPFPWTDADITRATETLRALGERWSGSGSDDALEFTWPHRLIPQAR
jgi:hypothetical protein